MQGGVISPPPARYWLYGDIPQRTRNRAVKAVEADTHRRRQLVAIVVRDVVHAHRNAATIAHKPAGTVHTDGTALGVIAARAADLAVTVGQVGHFRTEHHRNAICQTDLPGQVGGTGSGFVHRQELVQIEQCRIGVPVHNPCQIKRTAGVARRHGKACLAQQ